MKREENFEVDEEEPESPAAEGCDSPNQKLLKKWDPGKEPSARRASVLNAVPKHGSVKQRYLTAANALAKHAKDNRGDMAIAGKARSDAEHFFKEAKKG